MTDREKLIDLLCKAKSKAIDEILSDDISYAQQLEIEADHLLANGVTIQSWIPVSERLPDTFGTFIVAVRIPTRKRTYSDSADFDPFAKKWTPSLFWGKGMDVTHWMPLPEPPREE